MSEALLDGRVLEPLLSYERIINSGYPYRRYLFDALTQETPAEFNPTSADIVEEAQAEGIARFQAILASGRVIIPNPQDEQDSLWRIFCNFNGFKQLDRLAELDELIFNLLMEDAPDLHFHLTASGVPIIFGTEQSTRVFKRALGLRISPDGTQALAVASVKGSLPFLLVTVPDTTLAESPNFTAVFNDRQLFDMAYHELSHLVWHEIRSCISQRRATSIQDPLFATFQAEFISMLCEETDFIGLVASSSEELIREFVDTFEIDYLSSSPDQQQVTNDIYATLVLIANILKLQNQTNAGTSDLLNYFMWAEDFPHLLCLLNAIKKNLERVEPEEE